MAMGPKINKHLALVQKGNAVRVKGPTGDWEPYAKDATFIVVIGQVQGSNFVLAVGGSNKRYTPKNKTWSATATVITPNGALQPGVAYGWALASVEMKNGSYEPYEWSVVVQLIDKPPLP